MADIKIANAEYHDVEQILLKSPSGEDVPFYLNGGSSDVPFKYGGFNGVKICEYQTSFALADTSFVIGSSASTSATSINATVSNMFTTPDSPTIAYGDKDIIVVQTCLTHPVYNGRESNKAKQLLYGMKYFSHFSKRKTTDTSAKTTRQVYSTSCYVNKYYNASGVISRAVANYGFYMTPSAPTIASATANSTYVRCSSPVLYYRASSTYLSTTNIKLVTDCSFYWKVEVFTVDPFSTFISSANDEIDDLLINGF